MFSLFLVAECLLVMTIRVARCGHNTPGSDGTGCVAPKEAGDTFRSFHQTNRGHNQNTSVQNELK